MNAQIPSISVTAPVGQAIERVRTVLFRPFDLGRWFVIGFGAWLASLGQGGGGGGGGFNWNPNGRYELERTFEHAKDYVVRNLDWILPLALGLTAFGLMVMLLFTWLSSRGQFLFLHGVATNRAEIGEPWRRYRVQGNSLFWLRVVLGLACLILLAPCFVGGFFLVSHWLTEGFQPLIVVGLVALVLAAVTMGLFFALLKKLTFDFAVPIMALHGTRSLAAWRVLLSLMGANLGWFCLYLLFSLLLGMVIGIAIFAIVLLTCCCAGCLFAIPYLGTVALLPVLVFGRAYSLHFLAQFGPEYDLLRG